MSRAARMTMLDKNHAGLSIRRQCNLLGLTRSTLYYESTAGREEDLVLMHLIDQVFTTNPTFGSRSIVETLSRYGHVVNRKRVIRLMQEMGLQAIYPKKRTTFSLREHKKYPYLLGGLEINQPNQVWATDITYIRMRHGFLYLVLILDWFSRYALSWRLSNTLDAGFCLEALDEALNKYVHPEIFNSDQGCQFTSEAFTAKLQKADVQISMAGKGRCYDNIFIERFWRTLKYEEVYLKSYDDGIQAEMSLKAYIKKYNERRPHQALNNKTPQEAYLEIPKQKWLKPVDLMENAVAFTTKTQVPMMMTN